MCLGQKVINKIFLALLFFYSVHVSAANTLFDNTFFTNKTATVDASGWWRSGSSLDLDFANNRYYLQGVSYTSITSFIAAAGASFTRTSTATYVNSSGDVVVAAAQTPRFTYNSKTLDSQGILIEESSVNYATNSENAGGAAWSVTAAGSITVSATTSPDGLNNGNLISFNGTTNSFLNKGTPSVASQTVTRSLFVKAASSTSVIFEFSDPTNCANYCTATFNLATGTASWSASKTGQGNLHLVPYKNGWYRASATMTYSASGTAASVTYVGCYGSCAGSVYVWGMQIEYKSMPTSYIPTGSTSATRTADSFKIPVGTWFDTTKGTFLTQAYGNLNGSQIGYARIIGLDGAKCLIGFGGPGTGTLSSWDGTANLALIPGSFTYPTTTYQKPVRIGVAWDESTSRSLAGGGSLASGTVSVGSYNTTHIYPGGSAYNPLNAPVMRATYFSTKQSDTFLKNMAP